MSPYNTELLENRVNNSCNYILDDLVNSLAKESDNKNSKNIMDKGKAENNSNGSNNSDNTNDNDFGNSNSSDSNKGDEARRYIKWQRLPTPITS